MEYRFYIKSKDKSHKVFKISQGANLDITIIPSNALYFSKEIIHKLNYNDHIELKYDYLGTTIDHYSAHAITGQRHVKILPKSPAHEKSIGHKLASISKPIPLLTLVATANNDFIEEPKSGKWFGINLPEDVNYLIIDLIAIPLNSQLGVQQTFQIKNERITNETFDICNINMRNCIITALMKSTNHNLTDIPNNIIFQQVEGKTVTIIRVERGMIIAQISELEIK